MFEQKELVDILGDAKTNQVVQRFEKFAFLPHSVINSLAEQALSEQWGKNNYALKKYLAVQVSWAIEQGRYTTSSDQFYVRAGHLHTRYGTPLYLVFEANSADHSEPYVLCYAGSNVSAASLPSEPDIPEPPEIPVGMEIVMLHEHILGNDSNRVPFLADTPSVAQMCAVSGAIQWSLNRNLQLPYWYFGVMNYLVPLYLQSREDITKAPDVIAPIQITHDSLNVRTVLEAHMPYANSRVSVKRHDQLPHWMLAAWESQAEKITEQQIEEPESEADNVASETGS